jgi:isopenicillin N synthase-like dioxygenase
MSELANNTVNIKTIDLTRFLQGNEAERRAVALEIGAACEEIGFLIITGHGIPDGVIDDAWTSTARFFDRPLEEKQQLVFPQEVYPFGYSIMGEEILSAGKQAEKEGDSKPAACPDLKEMFSVGPTNAGFTMERKWPANPAEFGPAMTAYYDALNGLANHILRAMAIALDLDERYFERFTDKHASALRYCTTICKIFCAPSDTYGLCTEP